MKTRFVSLKNAVNDFVQDTGLSHDEFDDKILLKWGADCVRWFNTDQQLRHRIVILQVRNSRAELPDDYEILTQAAARVYSSNPCDCVEEPQQPCCQENLHQERSSRINPGLNRTRHETIVQWVYNSMHDDCKVEVNLFCPHCKKKECDCGRLVVEVDVDSQWLASHPEAYYDHFTRKGSFGYNNQPSSYYSPDFSLMRYATNNFFNLTGVLGDCPNINCLECEHEFKIELPYIEVDFEKGEVLVSYLGKVLDDDGEIMIPDHPDAFEAIFHHLRYKWNLLQSDRKNDQLAMAKAMQSKQLRDEAIMLAKSSLQMPSAHEWKSWLQNSSWLKRIPNWHMDVAGKNIIDQQKRYLK